MTLPGRLHAPGLQSAIDHAARFCQLLDGIDIDPDAPNALGRAWLLGRSEEVQIVLACIVQDCRAGRLQPDAAESAANTYLHALHIGAQRRLLLSLPLACCGSDEAMTRVAVAEDVSVTRPLPRSGAVDPGAATVFDPTSLLDCLPPEDRQPLSSDLPLGSSIARSVRIGGSRDD